MSNRIFVGTAEKSKAWEAQHFEEFHARLMAVPEDITRFMVRSRLRGSAIDFYETKVFGTTKDQLVAIKHHLAGAYAEEQLEIHQGRRPVTYNQLGRLSLAAASIRAVGYEHGWTDDWLEDNVFTRASSQELIVKLSNHVARHMAPYGAYDRYAFAAGFAEGEITYKYETDS
jgi:hypothetical protein